MPVRGSDRAAIRRRDLLVLLVLLVALGALAAAAAGLFAGGGEGGVTMSSPRGETFETYGEGVYRADSAFKGGGFRGTDIVTLFLGVPFLLLGGALHLRGSTRGTLLLSGALLYILYVYASLSLTASYNSLFLLYVALFGASLFAFVLALRAVDLGAFDITRMPRRLAGMFLLASAVATAAIWLGDLVPPLVRGETPELQGYTTRELGFGERAVMHAVRAAEGDFRDWDAIRGWAAGIAAALRS